MTLMMNYKGNYLRGSFEMIVRQRRGGKTWKLKRDSCQASPRFERNSPRDSKTSSFLICCEIKILEHENCIVVLYAVTCIGAEIRSRAGLQSRAILAFHGFVVLRTLSSRFPDILRSR